MVEGWEKEMELRRKTTLCMFLSSFVKVWAFFTFQVALTIPCISGKFSQGCRTPEHRL